MLFRIELKIPMLPDHLHLGQEVVDGLCQHVGMVDF